ncbi:signal recognition particle-docking protein FtsY [Mobilicoccus massiliensis]|uniref:signal recognition particle-docking protein FtsY n=1 Tax=Mobilicoccus massiliensis TaxID=1522310 RepID=UPI000AE1EFC1|nr:signal recognition particle-docking protein FtsY [Mobilicoccus massiliensis]
MDWIFHDLWALLTVVGVLLVAGVGAIIGLVRGGGRRRSIDTKTRPDLRGAPSEPGEPSEGAPGGVLTEERPGVVVDEPVAPPSVETPESTRSRLQRLRSRLARSDSALSRGLLALLQGGQLDEDTWDDVESTLLAADLGVEASTELVAALKNRVAAEGVRDEATMRGWLKEDLFTQLQPQLDRRIASTRVEGRPAVIMVVGVNGTGKTTTIGKLARVLVAENRDVLLGAADTFRAAAADQLETWGARVGVPTVRSEKEGADPASVAYEAVAEGIEAEADVVILDTAGRLHNKADLMNELAKVKRVVEKKTPIDEVLLVLDATTGQNGMRQAEVFSDVVDVTGIVLTKLDGTAKGGIVVAVQKALGVPVKLVGLGEGPDDLAPFDPKAFAEALLGE